MVIVLIIMSTVSMIVVASRFDSGFYQLLMHKGGNKYSYAFSLYISDFFVHVIVMAIAMTISYIGGVRFNGFWVAALLFCMSNPIFIMCISYSTQYARRNTKVMALIVLSLASGAAYFNVIVM